MARRLFDRRTTKRLSENPPKTPALVPVVIRRFSIPFCDQVCWEGTLKRRGEDRKVVMSFDPGGSVWVRVGKELFSIAAQDLVEAAVSQSDVLIKMADIAEAEVTKEFTGEYSND